MQDLSGFSVPKGFRGGNAIKSAIVVGSTGNNICPGRHKYCIAGGHFYYVYSAQNRKNVVIRPSVKITYPWKLTLGDYAWVGDEVNLYTLGEITIGAHSVISQRKLFMHREPRPCKSTFHH